MSNLSDHRPVCTVCQLEFGVVFPDDTIGVEQHSSIVWNKASNEDLQRYTSLVYSRLDKLSTPDDVLFCTNPLGQEHKSAMDCYCQSICDCLIESAEMCVPTTTVSKRVARWNVSARLLKHQASFWHQLWVDCGSLSAGVTAEIKKKTKQRYKAETRRLKRRQNYICRKKMGNALAANYTRNFWSKVKQISFMD